MCTDVPVLEWFNNRGRWFMFVSIDSFKPFKLMGVSVTERDKRDGLGLPEGTCTVGLSAGKFAEGFGSHLGGPDGGSAAEDVTE